tara:strand:- start:54 stop:572 length:519 start_codon:yes stop_codon:yes gene_type:complete
MSYKKWIHKYQFLKEDLSDVEKSLEEYTLNFSESFVFNDKEENNLPLEVDHLPERVPDNKCKPIFKRLSKTLHPDKGGNGEDFTQLSENYRNQDIVGLYLMAEKYKIDIEDLITKEIIPLFESSCKQFEDIIEKKKSTVAWGWGNISSPEEREMAIKYIEKEHNLVYKRDKK